jgi:hypothetical protein
MAASTTLPHDPNHLMFPRDVAAYLGVSIATLERWRMIGEGPAFVKVGRRRIAYRARIITDWLTSRERASTSETPPGKLP